MENIYKELLNGNLEKDVLNEINQILEEELLKKPSERDYDKIAELTKTYSELSGEEDFIHEATKRGISQLIEQDVKRPQIHMMRKLRLWLTVGVAAVIMLTVNMISVAAFQQNVFSVVVNYAKKGFSVEPPETEKIELPTSPEDPYGIIAECAKYELYPETPHYLPEGFVLENIEVFNEDVAKRLTFHYIKNNETIAISYKELYDSNFKSGIPSDHFNLEEVQVNGKSAIISKEDGQFTLIYYDDNVEYIIATNHLDYDECNKIVASIKK